MIQSVMFPKDVFMVDYIKRYLRQTFLAHCVCKRCPLLPQSLFSASFNQYPICVFLVVGRAIVLDRVYSAGFVREEGGRKE